MNLSAFRNLQNFDQIFIVVFGVSMLILLGITAAMCWFVWRYYYKRHPVAVPITGNLKAEILWTAIPSALVLVLFYYGWEGYKALRTVPEDAMEVTVIAKMWSWQYIYADGRKNEILVVPVGKPVKLELKTMDVIHSFYAPAFRIKMDTVPGMSTYAWFKADVAGDYNVLCAEYCGMNHAKMLSTIRAVPPGEFAKWAAAGNEKQDAMALFNREGCLSCHSVDGTPGFGPSFKGIYGKKIMVILPNNSKREVVVDDAYLHRALHEPDAEIVDGYSPGMPPLSDTVTAEEEKTMLEWFRNN